MSWRYKLNACDTRLMRETWHHRVCVCVWGGGGGGGGYLGN